MYYVIFVYYFVFFFFSSRRRHTRLQGDWSSDVCSSDLLSIPRNCSFVQHDFRPSTLHRRHDSYGFSLHPYWKDRKSTRLNSSHLVISYAVFCLKKKKKNTHK